ncbi:hypothetical protein [Caulobacter sp. FWC2]|uniref:hypothetical protein n=1 Tax=Caulobacter sp. FWC2 TaxID=69664 RepID=UPI000C154251|nr:hypothetical protein [Caulobacter sp. FWC2]PIB93106.1 hypothetical protein CSW62_16880 [Caulobacter sp. FWC2]
MRYRELIETGGELTTKIGHQRERVTSASAVLASKEASAKDARVAAQKLPLGSERSRRLQAAGRREADARRAYNDTRNTANDRIRDLMAKK